MPTSVNIGVNPYNVPKQGERSWGPSVTSLLVSLAAEANKVNISTYPLIDKNAKFTDGTGNYGVEANFFTSNTLNSATSGILRLGATEAVSWRNATPANPDRLLTPVGTTLSFDSIELVNLSYPQTLTSKTITSAILDGAISGSSILDEDDFISNSSTQLATQQSIKAYVDAATSAQDQLSELVDTAIVAPSSAQVLIYNNTTGTWDNKTVSGDVTTLESGATTISPGAIVDSKVDAGANIAWTKLDKTGSNLTDLTTKSHTSLTDIGTNTHAQVDTHIADAALHFTEGSVDHTAIQNIGTNTHAQIDTHIANVINPHAVTQTQVGLSNVDNTSDVTKDAAATTLTNKTISRTANSILRVVTTAVGALTLSATHDIILVNGAVSISISLPDAANFPGKEFVVKNITTNLVTMTSVAGTIDGLATFDISQQYATYVFVSDGANWFII